MNYSNAGPASKVAGANHFISLASLSSRHKGRFTLKFYFCTLCILFGTAPHLEVLSSPSGLDLYSFLQPGAELILPVSRTVVVLHSLFRLRMALVKDSYLLVSQTVQVQTFSPLGGFQSPSSNKSGSTHFSLTLFAQFSGKCFVGALPGLLPIHPRESPGLP